MLDNLLAFKKVFDPKVEKILAPLRRPASTDG